METVRFDGLSLAICLALIAFLLIFWPRIRPGLLARLRGFKPGVIVTPGPNCPAKRFEPGRWYKVVRSKNGLISFKDMPGSIEAEFFERPEMPKQSLLVQMPLLGLFGIGLGGFFSHSPIMTAIVILLAILMIIGLFKIVKSFFKILIIIGIIVILIYFLTNIR